MGWTLVPGASLVAAPWRNGLGTSRDIVVRPGPEGGLGWTVSIADLERDADFSHYPHGDRVFTPIAGAPPPELAFNDGSFEPCPLLVPRRFSGETPTRSRIPAQGRAFNAIVDRRHYRADVAVLHLSAQQNLPAAASAHVVVHCLIGSLMLGPLTLGPGDSAVGSASDGGGVMAQDGVVLVVSIDPASAKADPPGA